jgi:hypothetical protein
MLLAGIRETLDDSRRRGPERSLGVVRTTKDQTVAAGHSVAPACWQAGLDESLGRVADRFGRVEPRRHARAFVLGLLADLPRKHCWTIAEHAGDASPDGMHSPTTARSGLGSKFESGSASPQDEFLERHVETDRIIASSPAARSLRSLAWQGR